MKEKNYTPQKVFELLDTDKDGIVNHNEFANHFLTLKIPEMQVKDFDLIFTVIDTNDDNKISKDEFTL